MLSATIPAPACRVAPCRPTNIVRIAIAVSRLPEKSTYPTTPAYGPRFEGSSASIISIARTFGAPLTVPAGSVALNTSIGPRPSRNVPETCEVKCMTWLYLSSDMNSSTFIEPNLATRPTSLRARSTSITCSARSFGFSFNSPASLRSCSSSLPRLRVPAIGRLTTRPLRSCTIGSGDEPTIVMSSCLR